MISSTGLVFRIKARFPVLSGVMNQKGGFRSGSEARLFFSSCAEAPAAVSAAAASLSGPLSPWESFPFAASTPTRFLVLTAKGLKKANTVRTPRMDASSVQIRFQRFGGRSRSDGAKGFALRKSIFSTVIRSSLSWGRPKSPDASFVASLVSEGERALSRMRVAEIFFIIVSELESDTSPTFSFSGIPGRKSKDCFFCCSS